MGHEGVGSGKNTGEAMLGRLSFDTPENVTVTYDLAGLGTRFVAWVFDMLIIVITQLLIVLALALFAAGFNVVIEPIASDAPLYGVGLVILLFAVLPLAYFCLFELLMQGQTPGKRSMRLRVVMAEGFSLTPGAVFIRSAFRLIDSIPLFWVVPFLSRQGRRFGDMVGGTVVISEAEADFRGVEMELAQRSASEAMFRFSTAHLSILEEDDFEAVTAYLRRRASLDPAARAEFAGRLVQALTARMQYAVPPPAEHDKFLEDLLAAHLRRQVSQVG